MGIQLFSTLLLLFILFQVCWSNAVCEETLEDDDEWTRYLIPENYNEKVPPYRPGCPLEVNITIIPWGIGEISIEHMYFEVNVYLSFRWFDYRLNITNPKSKALSLEEKLAERIWTPDVAFRNCLNCDVIAFNHRIDKLNFVGKNLLFYVRKSAKLYCEFDLSYYPMDRHTCFIEVETAGDKKDTVVLRDKTPFLGFLRNSSIPQFKVSDWKTGICSVADRTAKYKTCIEYRMTFTRQLAYHLMLTYAPSFLIVILTWISFWLEARVAPPRVALGLTSLLTLATQFSNAQKNLPPVSYVKAIDIWMFTCIFMVFGSLLEFAVAYTSANEKTKADFPQQIRINHWAYKTPLLKQKEPNRKKTNRIDSASKVAFPLMFLVFNVCYWGFFCTR